MTMREWEPGDQVLCRTALGDEVIGTATSGIVSGRDMQVVWIDFGDRHCLPWPVEAVRATSDNDGYCAPECLDVNGGPCDTDGGGPCADVLVYDGSPDA